MSTEVINDNIKVACVSAECFYSGLILPHAASLQSKRQNLNCASLGECVCLCHVHRVHTQTLPLPNHYAGSVRWMCSSVSVLVIMLNYVYNFATRYVSLIQIWRTEYTRTQLPGPPEEPMSPGQDQIERNGNVTDSAIRYECVCFIYNSTNICS